MKSNVEKKPGLSHFILMNDLFKEPYTLEFHMMESEFYLKSNHSVRFRATDKWSVHAELITETSISQFHLEECFSHPRLLQRRA